MAAARDLHEGSVQRRARDRPLLGVPSSHRGRHNAVDSTVGFIPDVMGFIEDSWNGAGGAGQRQNSLFGLRMRIWSSDSDASGDTGRVTKRQYIGPLCGAGSLALFVNDQPNDPKRNHHACEHHEGRIHGYSFRSSRYETRWYTIANPARIEGQLISLSLD